MDLPWYSMLPQRAYQRQLAEPFPEPVWVHFNTSLADEVAISVSQNAEGLNILSAAEPLQGYESLSTAYSGHQFGVFNPSLGDGRGLLYSQWLDATGQPWELHLKGTGRTAFSRHGDGRAVLRSSIREYLGSEAMAALRIPTTRALSLVCSNKLKVQRERLEPAAILGRVARTHVRFGHFEYFFYRGDRQGLDALRDWLFEYHYPQLYQHRTEPETLLAFLQVQVRQLAELIAAWQAVGFAHGVMNTDNMSIMGDTLDYGPFGFLNAYQPQWVCNHSDHQGRYAFDQQPQIAYWNLLCLAQTFVHWAPPTALQKVVDQFPELYRQAYLKRMRSKLGLLSSQPEDAKLITDWLAILADVQADYSLSFRALLGVEGQHPLVLADYVAPSKTVDDWLDAYQQRLGNDASTASQRWQLLKQNNPAYILRNYLAQQAIERAEQGDFSEVDRLFHALQHPYDEQGRFW
jgi:uncharacterized protein YdiU (UPF0061 family)